jgi:hypothetical protein
VKQQNKRRKINEVVLLSTIDFQLKSKNVQSQAEAVKVSAFSLAAALRLPQQGRCRPREIGCFGFRALTAVPGRFESA